ncbi:MAG: DMT family transporter [Paracoccaceae bacterium]
MDRSAQTGLALMAAAMLVAPGLDVMAKLLMERLPPLEVAFGRFLAQTLCLLPLLALLGAPGRPRAGHAAAGLCLGLALLFINLALREMPVANVLAIFFVEPLILSLLGALLLGERLGARRLAAVGVGLLGALVVLRPNLAAFGPAALWPLAAAVAFAFYMIFTRAMSLGGRRLALQFWTGFIAALALGLALGAGTGLGLVRPLAPTGPELALFAAIGALAVGAHQLILAALARIETGLAAPMQYLEIASATLLGWLVFGAFPDPLTWAGTALIVASGLYVFHRERQTVRPVPPTTP